MSYEFTCRVPPDFIKTPLPDFIVIFSPEDIVKVIPFGITSIELFCTSTFAGAMNELESIQLEVIVQVPESGNDEHCGKPWKRYAEPAELPPVLSSCAPTIMFPSGVDATEIPK